MNLFYKICGTRLKHDVVLKYCLFTSCSGMADLISHQFTEPGLYHYVFNMADLSQFKGYVAVKPQPTEHVMGIHNGQFKPCRYHLNVLCRKQTFEPLQKAISLQQPLFVVPTDSFQASVVQKMDSGNHRG